MPYLYQIPCKVLIYKELMKIKNFKKKLNNSLNKV